VHRPLPQIRTLLKSPERPGRGGVWPWLTIQAIEQGPASLSRLVREGPILESGAPVLDGPAERSGAALPLDFGEEPYRCCPNTNRRRYISNISEKLGRNLLKHPCMARGRGAPSHPLHYALREVVSDFISCIPRGWRATSSS
jgi:hypothetical protein